MVIKRKFNNCGIIRILETWVLAVIGILKYVLCWVVIWMKFHESETNKLDSEIPYFVSIEPTYILSACKLLLPLVFCKSTISIDI